MKKYTSSPKKLSNGVPQGSLLGPLFYTLYTSDLESIVAKYGLGIHTYADDCQIYASYSDNGIEEMESNLQLCLDEIKSWMDGNYLRLNKDKTDVKAFWAKKTKSWY